jgi:hypothetical protein
MSSTAAGTLTTSRQYVEEAMRRIVDQRTAIAGSTWQHIVRFFRGDLERARVSFLCEPAKQELIEEDGTPAMVSVMLSVRISSHIEDLENEQEHDETTASIIGLMYDAAALRDSLNAAMSEDYSERFVVKYCEPIGDAETRIEGSRQVTECRATIWLPPPESATAWATQNQ